MFEFIYILNPQALYAFFMPGIQKRDLQIDILRGLAIGGVIAVHSIQTANNFSTARLSERLTYTFSLGKYGVELFFFISGYLLTSIYGVHQRSLPSSYWIRRIARIYPLWTVFVLFAIFRAYFFQSGGFYDVSKSFDFWLALISALTFTGFISPILWNGIIPGAWSIQAEVAHYILFPLIRVSKLKTLFSFLTVLNIITIIYVYARPLFDFLPKYVLMAADSWIRLGLYSTLGFFLIGLLTSLYTRKKSESSGSLEPSELTQQLGITNISLYGCTFCFVPCPFGFQLEAFGFVVVCILLSFLIMRSNTSSYFFSLLGKYSYFIYFIHHLILEIFQYTAHKNLFQFESYLVQPIAFALIFLIVTLVSVVLGALSYKFFELPIIEYSKRN